MKLQLALPLAFGAALVTAAPTVERTFQARDSSSILPRDNPIFDLSHLKSLGLTDSADDWAKIKSKTDCPAVAAIFARGTFDSGNIGVFVGPELFMYLKKDIPGVANQGVDSSQYPATLMDYLKKSGGSDTGAEAMANQAVELNKVCGTQTAIVFLGWSQGAIVCRKALGIVTEKHPDVLKQIAGMGTFGDPHVAWEAATKPILFPKTWTKDQVKSMCVEGLPHVDFLCAPFSEKGYKIPTSPKDFLGPWGTPKDVESVFKGSAQAANGVCVLKHLTQELTPVVGSGAIWPLMKVVLSAHPTRAALRPAHFTYGDNGMAEEMAKFVAGLSMVKKSIDAQGKGKK